MKELLPANSKSAKYKDIETLTKKLFNIIGAFSVILTAIIVLVASKTLSIEDALDTIIIVYFNIVC